MLTHVLLHAAMQRRSAANELDEAKSLTEESTGDVAERRAGRHTKTMILGTLDGLRRTLQRLESPEARTTWGNYDTDHSYGEASYEEKKSFIQRHAAAKRRTMIWDIGSNTGTFSRLCAPHAEHVVSIDGDSKAIERLYIAEREKGSQILPLVMNLSNVSPGQGWRGRERKRLEERGRPDLVLCLALSHHMVIGANIPMEEFVSWLHDLGGDLIIEFVSREDDMVRMLLRNKVDQYGDYTIDNFERLLADGFEIVESEPLKGGHRQIYSLRRK